MKAAAWLPQSKEGWRMRCVIVVRKEDKVAEGKARALNCELAVSDDWQVRGDATLFIAPGTIVPWDLVAAGFNFMLRWDAAAPLWRYGITAEDLGTAEERQRTKTITRDLRIPVYAPELLFVRNSPDGQALVTTWRAECEGGADERLAFVRALYLVKPRFCALPRTWLADVAKRAEQDAKAAAVRQARRTAGPLVTVQIGPNQFVRCRPGDENEVVARINRIRARRGDRGR